MATLLQDVRYALRLLRKSPGFTVVSVLTLALGIVGTVLVFNAYNATAWQQLPAHDPQHLAVLDRRLLKGGHTGEFSLDEYRRIRDSRRAFSAVAAEGDYDTVLAQLPDVDSGTLQQPRQVLIKFVSDNYFDLLGVAARAGRVWHAADRSSGAPAAVLSYSSWHRRFHDDPAVLGQTAFIYGAAVTIVGIMPRNFVGSGDPPIPPDFWIPLVAQASIEPQRAARNSEDPWLRIVGRLKPATTRRQAESELTALEQQAEHDRGGEPLTASIVAGPAFYFIEPGNPQFQVLAALLLASFGMVLLVACANMANFFMARAAARRREMAVRSALGARRSRLLRQLITEGVILGLAGGAVAVVAATWICNLVWVEVEQRIIARFTDLYSLHFSFSPSWRVLAATCFVSIVAGALFSLTGAVQSSRVDLNETLKGSELALAPKRGLRLSMRDLLIATQVTLSVVLLISAAVLLRGMVRGQSANPGFSTHNVLDIEFAGLQSAGYDAARIPALRSRLLDSMKRVPGVSAVAFASHVPLLGSGQIDIATSRDNVHRGYDNNVSPGFFTVLGIPLLRGRDFTAADIEQNAAVVIVSQATAQNLWGKEDPLGRWIAASVMLQAGRFRRPEMGSNKRPMQVIGVAQDVRSVNIGLIEPYFVYLPLAADAPLDDIFLRATGDAARIVPDAWKAAAAVDPKLASLGVAHPLDDALWMQHLPSLVATVLAALVGSLALILAGIGIYGTIAYAVAQRTREIGIRMALGAPRHSIVRLVLSRTLAVVASAASLGMLVAAGVSHAITAVPFGLAATLLFGTSPWDPLAYAGTLLFLAMVALAAAYRPTTQATAVDPMVALRYE